MVVIAIIIILAAIAIPNYLKMTERAKRSRLASDFATLATVLETFKTDWGIYPIAAAEQAVNGAATVIRRELSQGGTGTAVTNIAGQYNAVGEQGPVNYIKDGTLTSMINPFIPTNPVTYLSTATGSTGWAIWAQIETGKFLYRTDSMSTVSEAAAAPTVP
jgi:type II secretory pathway pseudopilin PulG